MNTEPMYHNSMHSKRGVTLIEIMVALTIMAVIAGIAIPTFMYIQRRAELTAIRETVKNTQGAVVDFKQQYGSIPVTDGSGGGSATTASVSFSAQDVTDSCNGAAFAVAGNANALSNAIRLDMVFRAMNPDWTFFNTSLCDPSVTLTPQTNPIVFDVATKRFKTSPVDRAVTAADSNLGAPRLECSRVTGVPNEYNNNYYIAGDQAATAAFANGTKIIELIIENGSQKLLNELSEALSPEIPVTALTTAVGHSVGRVKATRLDANSRCTIRIFCCTAN